MNSKNKKTKERGRQCSLCTAEFEVWLDNSAVSEEKKEKISQRLLNYCPVCTQDDEK